MTQRRHVVLCNGAPRSTIGRRRANIEVLTLDYQQDDRVRLELATFAHASYHIPARCLDLIEIAAYVLAADRLIDRGPNDSLEFRSWGRLMHFHIRVRDARFWRKAETRERLTAALEFLSGDAEIRFTFLPGHSTPPAGIFDTPGFQYRPADQHRVMLFSGGLDSLGGAVETLLTNYNTEGLPSESSVGPAIHCEDAGRPRSTSPTPISRSHPALQGVFALEWREIS